MVKSERMVPVAVPIVESADILFAVSELKADAVEFSAVKIVPVDAPIAFSRVMARLVSTDSAEAVLLIAWKAAAVPVVAVMLLAMSPAIRFAVSMDRAEAVLFKAE